MSFVDTHAHLDYIAREGRDINDVLEAAKVAGMSWMVNPSVNLENIPQVLQIAETYPQVFAAVAVHPTDVQDIDEPNWIDILIPYLDHPKVVAIGETGLDYYWDKTHIETQHAFFSQFLSLGRERNLPVIVHDRDAHDDVHRLVSECPGVKGIMHCFSGDTAFGEAMIAQGFYISFAGNLTFKNAAILQEAAKNLPLESLLIETDSPFLSPMPFRGKPNEPARTQLVAEKIAELKGITYETVCEITTQNAKKVFGRC